MTSTAIVPYTDLEKMARAVAQSKLFGAQTVDQALAIMLVAQAEGLHPATAARDYHIIQGRPAMKADAMLARYLASGGKVKWHDHTDTKVSATFTHPSGGELTIDWDIERAKKAGLGGKDMWAKYPRQMLRARVISEGIRATNPAVATGIYTPEELQDIDHSPARGERAAPSSSPIAPSSAPAERDMGPVEEARVDATQIAAIKAALEKNDVPELSLLMFAGIGDISELAASDGPKAIRWIEKQKKAAA